MYNGFFAIFRKEWKTFLGSSRLLFWVWGLPLLIFLFLGWLFGYGVAQNLPVAITDYDQSTLSRQITRYIEATPTIKFTHHCTDELEAKYLLQRADVYGYVVIPKGFEKEIYKGESPKVICYLNNQFILPAGLIQKDFLAGSSTFSAGIHLDKQQKKGKTLGVALSTLQSVKTDLHLLYNPYTNYNYYLNFALLPMMFQLIVMVISIYTLGLVMKKRKARKLYELGNKNMWSVVFGKLLPYTISFSFVGLLMNIYLFRWVGIPTQTSLLISFSITALLVFATQSLAIGFVALSKDLRSAMSYGGGFSALGFSFSAYTFPMEGLPKSMEWLAQLFPYTHFMKLYVNTALKNLSIQYSLYNVYWLLGMCLLGGVLSISLRKLMLNNGYTNGKR